jgi:hypothetical protein
MGLGDVERLRRFAAELVALTPDVKAIYPVALTVPEPPIPALPPAPTPIPIAFVTGSEA